MGLVRVIAKKDFAHEGKAVYAGQAVFMSPVEALRRSRDGEVSLDPQARETYQTRDMVAAPAAVETVKSPDPVQPRARRAYRRKSKAA